MINTPEAVDRLRSLSNDYFHQLDEWFDKPPALLIYQPVDGSWSPLQILDHIRLTNHYLLLLIEKGCRKARSRFERQKTPQHTMTDFSILEMIADKPSLHWHRPDHMEPGKNISAEKIRQPLQVQQNLCLQLVEMISRGEGLFYSIRLNLANLGKLDMYQWIYFLLIHIRRHLVQLRRREEEWMAVQSK